LPACLQGRDAGNLELTTGNWQLIWLKTHFLKHGKRDYKPGRRLLAMVY
jgi:hypothetical protein